MTHHDACDLIRPKWSVKELVARFQGYRRERRELLMELGRPDSQRDPLSELAEHLVAALLPGKLAANRVQRGWDVERPTGSKVQVKCLANPRTNDWRNIHEVRFPSEADEYALVIFEALNPTWILLFERGKTLPIYDLLGKSHANKESTLQIRNANLRAITRNVSRFEGAGMRIYKLPRF